MKPASFYRKKIDEIDIFQRSLTPQQKVRYAPRIEIIKREAARQAVLRSRQLPFITVPPAVGETPEGKEEPKTTKKEQAEKHHKSYLAFLSEIKPNIDSLDAETVEKARMTKASAIYHDEGIAAANQYLEQHKIPYDIDEGLSEHFSLVLTKKSEVGVPPEDIRIAYRGTKWNNLQDWKTNFGVLTNSKTTQHVQAEKQFARVVEKYGKKPSELISFSKGAVHSIPLGDVHGLPTTNFNPLVGPGMVDTIRDGNHRVLRTTTDAPSIAVGIRKQQPGFKVEVIEPFNDHVLPNKVHSIDNYTMAKQRQSEEIRTERVKAAGESASRLADAESVIDIHDFRAGVSKSRRNFMDIDDDGLISVEPKKSFVTRMKARGRNAASDISNMFNSRPVDSVIDNVTDIEMTDLSSMFDEAKYSPWRSTSTTLKPTPPERGQIFDVPPDGGDGIEMSVIQDKPVEVSWVEGAPPAPRLPSGLVAPEDVVADYEAGLFGDLVDSSDMGPFQQLPPRQQKSVFANLENRLKALSRDPDSTTPTEDLELQTIEEYVRNDMPDFDQAYDRPETYFRNKETNGKTFTDYIHSLDAGGTEVSADGAIKLVGNGFKNQRNLWGETGGEFTTDELAHFSDHPLNDHETLLEPEELLNLRNASPEGRSQILNEMNIDLYDKMGDVHGSELGGKPSLIGRGLRHFGASSVLGVGGQVVADTALDALDPDHKIQGDVRQFISGAAGGGLGETAVLRLSGAAVTGSALLPVMLGTGLGSVASYETDKLFKNEAPDQVYARDITSNMAGMTTAGIVTGGLVGGPVGAAVGALAGLGIGFAAGSASYLYNKYL